MDDRRFDLLARRLAGPWRRRRVLGAIASAVVGLAGARRPAPAQQPTCDGALVCHGDAACCPRGPSGHGPACCPAPRSGCCGGRCFDPSVEYCANPPTAVVCAIGQEYCRAAAGFERCGLPCPPGQVLAEDCSCRPCAAARASGAGTKAAGVCCNPATEVACGDRCCPKDGRCCPGGDGTASCCAGNRQCCAGPGGASCCDPAEAFCCNGACCAHGWACVGEPFGRCAAECPDGRPKCGRACCPAGSVCADEATGSCEGCGAGETPCGGRACCGPDRVCRDGRCACAGPTCKGACCRPNQRCVRGRCAKKRKR